MTTLQVVVSATLVAGLLLLVIALGLEADARDGTALLRQPARLLKSLFSMLVVMPIVACGLAYAFRLDPAVKIALVALALSPVPPFVPPRNIKAGAASSYSVGLLTTTAMISVIYVPFALMVLERVFDIPLDISLQHIVLPISWSVGLPLAAGMAVKALSPRLAARAAAPVGRLAAFLLLAASIPVVVVSLWRVLPLIGKGTLAALVAFSVTGLAVGHALGGSEPRDRLTLALSTAARHPGVAMAIARANFPDQALVLPTVVLYVLINTFVSTLYAKRTRTQVSVNAPAL
jgi:bile acid:Na+ symporter, BASS family